MIQKIKALLAKAASTTNEHEAEAFFAKAYELMEKHQIDSSDLEKDDPLGNEHVAQRNGRAAPDWDFRLMFAVAKYFGCRAIQMERYGAGTVRGRQYEYIWIGHEMDLIGRLSARVTAIEMHKYLVATVRKLGRERCREMGVNADTCARRIGVALAERLHELAPRPERAKTDTAKTNALVTVDAVKALYKKLHPDAKPIKGPAPLTNNMARDIADGVGLHRQTTHESVKRLA
jgi:hypothetical protein